MNSQQNETYEVLGANEIEELIMKNEVLTRQLIKTWRGMVRLADATIRLETENAELKRYRYQHRWGRF